MISYYYDNNDRGFGTYYIDSTIFPSVRRMTEKLGFPMVILSVFEFENKEDFNDAQK
jgi:hypothetical protein